MLAHTLKQLMAVRASKVVTRLLAAAPGAAELLAQLEAELPSAEDEVLLDRLPISIYGGG